MILFLHAVRGHVRTNLGSVQDRRQVQPLSLPVVDRLLRPELVGAADHLLELPEPELRHQLADLFGHEKEVVHDMFRLAGELRPERRIRSEEHTSELQSRLHLVCRLLLEKKKKETDTKYSRGQ